MTDHAVISAFLDDEPFEPSALAEALGDPVNRALLIDLIALRSLAQPEEAMMIAAVPPSRSRLLARLALAAAILIGGFFVGYRLGGRPSSESAVPSPTHVVKITEWQELTEGIR